MISGIRLAWRGLAKSPGFALTSVAALALGIGANTAIFSLVNQLLLNPPGMSNPDRIVAVRAKYDKLTLKSIPLSAPDFADVRSSREVFAHAAVMDGGDFNYTGGDIPERLQGQSVSVEWFDVFGAKPELGRTFRPEEDLPNADPVVILAHAAWKRLFGGDPSAVGKVIELNRKPYRIVGVMAPDFRPLMVDLWVPLGLPADAYDARNYFNEHLFAAARIHPGVSLARADAFVQVLANRVRNSGTTGGAYAQSSGWGLFTVPITDFLAGDTKKPMLVLLGAVGFVLLIACSNIAGLMVARTAGRAKEIAVRAALGAGKWQLVRHVMAESSLLALGGAALGLALAQAGIRLLLAIAPEDANIGLAARLDAGVLAFTALVAILSGVLFGLAPAWQMARFNTYEILKASGQSVTASQGRQRLRAALVVGEAALAVVLLAGAGLFLRSLTRLEDVRPGFDPRGVMTATLSLPNSRYKEPAQRAAFYRAVTERLAGVHGVETATIGVPLPFSRMGGSGSFSIEGRERGPGDPGPHGDIEYVAPGYFEAMRIPLKSGRYFTEGDRQGAEPVFIIDENLARQYWPNENPVGQHMRQGGTAWPTIVGVVGHVNRTDLAGDTGKGTYYYCLPQRPIPLASIIVKTAGDPASLGPAIREAVRAVDPTQPVHDLKTMQDLVQNSLAPRRFAVRLLGFFAMVALLLAALGLYGVISYSVAQRTQEIGVRMALGAERGSLLGMVVGQGLRLAALGVAVGLALTVVCGRMLESLFFGVSPFDPLTFAAISAALLGTASLASYVPARRATRVDPLRALRYE
jgi:predicted permease